MTLQVVFISALNNDWKQKNNRKRQITPINNTQHLHDKKPTTNMKRANENIYLRWLFVACFLWTWREGGRNKLSRAHYEFTVTKSQRKPKKIKYTKCTTSNWRFCRPRRSHDGVTPPWKIKTRSLMRMLVIGKQLPVGRRPRSRPGS